MATDVDVQFFSHLNGLVLGNNWGDLIRLLDKALVTGIDFTQITAASIDAQGDVHITLYSDHNAMLFQVVELSGFMPISLNQKYRIKGVPNSTQLILKPKADIVERTITTIGAGKLASLGYDIVFRDTDNVKRVYRAKNPTVQHPYIRVDETLSDGINTYTSSYAKYAMVGLLEHMDHIDDYQNPNVLQLPFDPADPAKNWKITGTGTGVVRGWSRWYWNRGTTNVTVSISDTTSSNTSCFFTIAGDVDCFYFLRSIGTDKQVSKTLCGCGLYDSCSKTDVIPGWFVASALTSATAGTNQVFSTSTEGATPIVNNNAAPNYFFVPKYTINAPLSAHARANAIVPDSRSGDSNYAVGLSDSTLEIPFKDNNENLRGNLKHILYSCNKNASVTQTTPRLAENSMYVADSVNCNNSVSNVGAFYFYLGELE